MLKFDEDCLTPSDRTTRCIVVTRETGLKENNIHPTKAAEKCSSSDFYRSIVSKSPVMHPGQKTITPTSAWQDSGVRIVGGRSRQNHSASVAPRRHIQETVPAKLSRSNAMLPNNQINSIGPLTDVVTKTISSALGSLPEEWLSTFPRRLHATITLVELHAPSLLHWSIDGSSFFINRKSASNVIAVTSPMLTSKY
jgi:hypothetical protein